LQSVGVDRWQERTLTMVVAQGEIFG